MIKHPTTFKELRAWFSAEVTCREYLVQLRWPDGVRCPFCHGSNIWTMKPPYYRCAAADCGRDFTVTTCTLFADTHKPLSLWFQAIWHVLEQKNGASALEIQRILGLGSYRTAWNWLHKLRRAMVLTDERDMLGGIVVVDDVRIFSPDIKKLWRPKGRYKDLILIAARDRGGRLGRIRLTRIVDASAANLERAVRRVVRPEACIWTDEWRGYGGLAALDYDHRVIRPKDRYYQSESKQYDRYRGFYSVLMLIERAACELKRWLAETHRGAVSEKNFDYYLDEFTFRFNHRNSGTPGELFERLLRRAVRVEPEVGKALSEKDPQRRP